MNKLVIICILIIGNFLIEMKCFRLKLEDVMIPTKASADSVSAASGNTAATNINADAQATTGHKAVGVSGGEAKTESVETSSGVVALAEAREDDKLVQAQAHQETLAQKSYAQQGDASVENINHLNYQTSATQKTKLDDTITQENTYQSDVGNQNTLTNSRQTISDVSLDTSAIQTQTGSPNKMNGSYNRDILITIDSGSEKLIIEKMISRDDRVIIVSAAKYLLQNLVKNDKDYIKQLLMSSCNCKNIKNYIIEMLTESA